MEEFKNPSSEKTVQIGDMPIPAARLDKGGIPTGSIGNGQKYYCI